ncbi:hypothetical protein BJX96DRAFT_168016 [Aspergillus floccosus]
MGPPRNNQRRPAKDQNGRDAKKDKKKPIQTPSRRAPQNSTTPDEPNSTQFDLSTTIPLTLQQLLLNVFKTGLLSADGYGWRQDHASPPGEDSTPLDIKSLIQTIKSHLYNRDFDSAFTEASEDLLCAYALRWSASRALGYAGVFKALLEELLAESSPQGAAPPSSRHVVCIGGGAGAEVVALAAVWRDLLDEMRVSAHLAGVSLQDAETDASIPGPADATTSTGADGLGKLAVTAVDIADWSRVVDRLAFAIQSADVPGGKTHPAPLHGGVQLEGRGEADGSNDFLVRFRRADVLSIPDAELKGLLHIETASTAMVTLMFTLNELFSTSMAKATGFLLRMTDLLQAGTLLVVVDSPGSYSTLKLGKGRAQAGGEEEAAVQERKYPMKFLLDHALLSVASGKWEKVLSQDSRWWRREAARLWYDVGEGAGLEDMRFQVHIYRRLDG